MAAASSTVAAADSRPSASTGSAPVTGAAKAVPMPFTEVRGQDAILNFIFDPSRAFISTAAPPAAPPAPHPIDSVPEPEPIVRARALEKEAIALAESGHLDDALARASEATSVAPEHGSAFNNRAQILRMMERNDEAYENLTTAIALERSWMSAHEDARESRLFVRHRDVLKQAHTQRAIIHRARGDAEGESRDMDAAAAYGSQFARVVTSSTNPYAALCSVAIKEMLKGMGEEMKASGTAGTAGGSSVGAATGPSPAPTSSCDRDCAASMSESSGTTAPGVDLAALVAEIEAEESK